LLLSYFRK